MKIIKGIGILVLFLAVGEVISHFIGNFMPGSVIGMLLIFAALLLKIVKPEDIRTVADFLTGNMTILFVPAFAGVIDQWGLIKLHFWGWAAIIIITTILVMLSSGAAAELTARIKEGKADRQS